MNLYEKTIKLSAQDFKEIIGVKRSTFETMVDILNMPIIQDLKSIEVVVKRSFLSRSSLC